MNKSVVRCFNPKCGGVPYAVNTGASRLAAHFGREVYKCECGSEWTVDVEWYARKLKSLGVQSHKSNLRRF